MKRLISIMLAIVLAFCGVVGLMSAYPKPAAAATFTVTTNSDAGDDAYIGSDLATDMADGYGLSLREAINWAIAGDTIDFNGGLSGQTITLNSNCGRLLINRDITIDGDLDDNGTPDITISGSQSGYVIGTDGLTSAAHLEGLTIADGNSLWGYGTGWFNYKSSPTITNCTFSSNSAFIGGGMYNSESSPTITNCTFSNNSVRARGGGMFNYKSSPTITNCTFSNNSTTGAGGGGMYNEESSLTITNCTFSNNSAENEWETDKGGGMYTFGGTLIVNSSSIYENTATQRGGGMYNEGGTLIVNSSSIYENTATERGGGLAINNVNATLNNNIFSNNTATGNGTFWGGGGISLSGGQLALINSIVNGNTSAAQGGGIRAGGACELIITNSTIVNNTADTEGGGIRIGQTNIITNSILWGNTSNTTGTHQFNGSPTVTYSLIQGGYPAGKKVISDDPSFVGPSIGDFHLTLDSPAIDAGKNSAVPTGLTVDLDGNPRIVNRTVDMGAFEYLTAQQADTLELIEQVGELVDSEVLNPGQGNSLIVKLEAAFDKMYQKDDTAINQLEAFINQVNDFMNSGILSQGEGEPLIYAANAIITALEL